MISFPNLIYCNLATNCTNVCEALVCTFTHGHRATLWFQIKHVIEKLIERAVAVLAQTVAVHLLLGGASHEVVQRKVLGTLMGVKLAVSSKPLPYYQHGLLARP